MKMIYEEPKMDIVYFENEDVITTSGGETYETEKENGLIQVG